MFDDYTDASVRHAAIKRAAVQVMTQLPDDPDEANLVLAYVSALRRTTIESHDVEANDVRIPQLRLVVA